MPVLLDTVAPRFLEAASTTGPRPVSLSVQVLRNLSELDAFGEEWTELVTKSGGGPQQSFAWNRAWFARYAESYDEMTVFVFLRGLTPLVILPLYRRGSAYRLAGDMLGGTQDVIAYYPEAVSLALETALDWARQRHCHLEFRRLADGGKLHNALEADERPWVDALKFQSEDQWNCHRTPESLEDLYEPLAESDRDALRRSFRRLDRDFPEAKFTCRPVTDLDDGCGPEVLEFCEQQGGLYFAGGAKDGRGKALVSDLLQSRDPGLRLATLRDAEGKLLAAEAGMSAQGFYQCLTTASRSDLEKYRPGDWLLFLMIDWLQRKDRVQTMSFLADDDRAFLWRADCSVGVQSCRLYPLGPMNLARWAGIRAGHGTVRISRQFLNRAGMYRPLI